MDYEKLKGIIKKANPEKWKIEKKHKYQKCSECMGYGYLVDQNGELSSDCFTCGGTCREQIEYLTALRGDIRLADVLLAIIGISKTTTYTINQMKQGNS